MTRTAPDRRPPSRRTVRRARPAPRHARPPSCARRQILTAAGAVPTPASGIGAIPVLSLFAARGAG